MSRQDTKRKLKGDWVDGHIAKEFPRGSIVLVWKVDTPDIHGSLEFVPFWMPVLVTEEGHWCRDYDGRTLYQRIDYE